MKLNNPLERVRDAIHSGMGKQDPQGRTFMFLQLDQLDPNPFQPRRRIDGNALEELRQSIAESGVIEPIVVRRKEDRYEIISGERRWRACQKLELDEIPCVLKEASDEETFKLALTENVQRNDLSPLEEALAFRRMLDMNMASNQAEVGQILGIRQQRVSDKLRLLQLPPQVQSYFDDFESRDRFTQKHGEILARLEDAEKIQAVAQRVVDESLSTRETRQIVDRFLSRGSIQRSARQQIRRLQVSRKRHGFTLKVSFDKRKDSIEETIQELMQLINQLQKEFESQEASASV